MAVLGLVQFSLAELYYRAIKNKVDGRIAVVQSKKSIIIKHFLILLGINFLIETSKHFALWLFNFYIKMVFIDQMAGKQLASLVDCPKNLWQNKILLKSVSGLLTCRHALLDVCQQYFHFELRTS